MNLSSQDLCVNFRANFVEDKEKSRRNTCVFQGILTQSSAKFAEKTRAISCEDRFLMLLFFQSLLVLSKYGDFVLCGGRPKGAALWKPATLWKSVDGNFKLFNLNAFSFSVLLLNDLHLGSALFNHRKLILFKIDLSLTASDYLHKTVDTQSRGLNLFFPKHKRHRS